MKLIRLAQVRFKGEPVGWLGHWQFEVSGVLVKKLVHEKAGGEFRLTLSAEIAIDRPEVLERKVKVPEEARSKCEEAIEFVANSISVQCFLGKTIISVTPPVFLRSESDQDRNLLGMADGIEQKPKFYRFHPYLAPEDTRLILSLTDRQRGIALFAEALNHDSASGAYRDLVRLFENAFGMPHSQLGKKLSQFLNPKMAYSRDEIETWLAQRNGASHGEEGRTEEIIMNSDVYWFIPRMEQAALDVLFNKKNWGTNSRDRHEIWDPSSFLKEPGSHEVTLTEGTRLTIALTDAYGVFPVSIDMPHMCRENFPQNWWPLTPYEKGKGPRWSVTLGNKVFGPWEQN